MLNLKDIASTFERGLNYAPGAQNVKFKIWVNAGQHTKPRRTKNSVTYYIDSILRPTASMNLGTLIDMGSWTLTLECLVPIPPPCVSANPTEEEMQRVYEEQYNYALGIFNAVDNYFAIAENISIKTEEGKTFSVGIRAGTAIAGLAQLLHGVGESVQLTVYIELGYTEGGINSRLSDVAIDTTQNIVPSMSTDVNRENVLQNDVYAGETNRRSVASASAFAIGLQLPLTDKTGQAYDFLVEGEINVAHFVYYRLNEKTTVYWMMVDAPVQSSREVANVGINYNLVEAPYEPKLTNVPESYQILRADFDESTERSLQFDLLAPYFGSYAKVGAQITYLTRSGVTVNVEERDFFYNATSGKYELYIITPSKIDMTMDSAGDDINLIKVQEAKNG